MVLTEASGLPRERFVHAVARPVEHLAQAVVALPGSLGQKGRVRGHEGPPFNTNAGPAGPAIVGRSKANGATPPLISNSLQPRRAVRVSFHLWRKKLKSASFRLEIGGEPAWTE